MYVQKTFLKGRSYLVQFGNTERRLIRNVLWTSGSGCLKDVIFKSLTYFLSHPIGNFLMHVICCHLPQKIQVQVTALLEMAKHVKWIYSKLPMRNYIFGQKNLSYFCNCLTRIKRDLHSQFAIQPKLRLNWKWNKRALIKWECILCSTIKAILSRQLHVQS